MKGWCVKLMHHPFRFMNQYVTAIGFSAREIVSRSCRGCRKAARVARVESRSDIGLQISMQLQCDCCPQGIISI